MLHNGIAHTTLSPSLSSEREIRERETEIETEIETETEILFAKKKNIEKQNLLYGCFKNNPHKR